MRALALLLVLQLAACAAPTGEPGERHRSSPPRKHTETALAAAITDAWQARTFRQKNRWKRSRRACAEDPYQIACEALAKKHRKARRKERRRR